MWPVVLGVCACLFFFGCRAQQLGQIVSPTLADSVHADWITAARNCWPSLRGSGTPYLAHSLSDPREFRAAFPAYTSLNDKAVEAIAEKPVAAAPKLDRTHLRHAGEPLLTRTEAADPDLVPDPNAPRRQSVTAETLCAVHTGSPVGFK